MELLRSSGAHLQTIAAESVVARLVAERRPPAGNGGDTINPPDHQLLQG